jgi:hypothetical protein
VASFGRAQTQRRAIEQTVESGIIAGILAGLPMAVSALIASALRGEGAFTAMYRVAALVDSSALKESIAFASVGRDIYYVQEPFFFGLIMRLAVAGFFGLVFGLGARAFGLVRAFAVPAGIIYGLAIMPFMGFVVLPVAADAFGVGGAISSMATSVGWGSWAIEHAVYGLGLGLWPLLRPDDFRPRAGWLA